MTTANPLVAERQDSTSFWAGTGVGEDISDLGEAIGNGSWLFGSLAGVGLAGDVVFTVFNPIAAAVSAGLGWLIEHIHPLDEMLEKVTGDADAVMAGAQTWTNIAEELTANAADLRDYVTTDMADQVGQAADAWRSRAKELSDGLDDASGAAEGIAKGLEIAAAIVQFVHDMIRDTITQAFGMLIQAAAEEIFSLGLLTPLVAYQTYSWIATRVTRLSGKIKDLITSISGLSRLLSRVPPGLTSLVGKLKKLKQLAPSNLAEAAGRGIGRGIRNHLPGSPKAHAHAGSSARAAGGANNLDSLGGTAGSGSTGGSSSTSTTTSSTGGRPGAGGGTSSPGHSAGSGTATGGTSGAGGVGGSHGGTGTPGHSGSGGTSTGNGPSSATSGPAAGGRTGSGSGEATGGSTGSGSGSGGTSSGSGSPGSTYHGLDPIHGDTSKPPAPNHSGAGSPASSASPSSSAPSTHTNTNTGTGGDAGASSPSSPGTTGGAGSGSTSATSAPNTSYHGIDPIHGDTSTSSSAHGAAHTDVGSAADSQRAGSSGSEGGRTNIPDASTGRTEASGSDAGGGRAGSGSSPAEADGAGSTSGTHASDGAGPQSSRTHAPDGDAPEAARAHSKHAPEGDRPDAQRTSDTVDGKANSDGEPEPTSRNGSVADTEPRDRSGANADPDSNRPADHDPEQHQPDEHGKKAPDPASGGHKDGPDGDSAFTHKSNDGDTSNEHANSRNTHDGEPDGSGDRKHDDGHRHDHDEDRPADERNHHSGQHDGDDGSSKPPDTTHPDDDPLSGPVTFKAPPDASPIEVQQVRDYVDGCNRALDADGLSETGRVSTEGSLSRAAVKAARAERALHPDLYKGKAVGHVPDTTWTADPNPHEWQALSKRVNGSLAGQARWYPIGYKPTEFRFDEGE